MTLKRKVTCALLPLVLAALLCTCILPMAATPAASAAAPEVSGLNDWTSAYTGDYYDNLNVDLTGAAFRNELAKLITDTHKKNPTYDELKTIFKTTDADPDNPGNVIWFYTGTSAEYTGAMDSGDYRTNREHVWPKQGGNAFPAQSDAGSDAHHLRPLNSQLNNTRDNHQFGEVPQTISNRVCQDGVSKDYGTSDPDTWCYLSGNYFYPAKGYRGATARILFYVQTRWGNQCDLQFVLGEGFGKTIGDIATLMKWHVEEPPTDQEIRRNEAVFNVQGNRNPFIDHPEYAEMIYCYNGQSYSNTLKNVVAQHGGYLGDVDLTPGPTSITLSPSQLTLDIGESQTITVNVTPSDADKSVNWTTSNGGVARVDTDGKVTAVSEGDATITATSLADSSVTATITVQVVAQQANREEFDNAMSALNNATSLSDRYSALRRAIDAYNDLSQTDKDAAASDYARLTQAVTRYNADVAGYNDDLRYASDFAVQAVSLAVSAALLAIVAIVGKRWWR